MSQIKVDAIEPRTAGGNIAVDTDTIVVDTTNNRVGIGESNPNNRLHIKQSADNSAAGLGLKIERNTNDTALFFGYRDNTDTFQINSSYTSTGSFKPISFHTSDAERMRILSSGGITFNGDTAAANALDDYEEGTWTPIATTSSGTIGSYNSGGYYTKIGREVHLDFYIQITNAGTGSGIIRVTGTPFTLIGINQAAGVASENALNGQSGSLVSSGTNQFNLKTYTGGNPNVLNYYWRCQVSHRTT